MYRTAKRYVHTYRKNLFRKNLRLLMPVPGVSCLATRWYKTASLLVLAALSALGGANTPRTKRVCVLFAPELRMESRRSLLDVRRLPAVSCWTA